MHVCLQWSQISASTAKLPGRWYNTIMYVVEPYLSVLFSQDPGLARSLIMFSVHTWFLDRMITRWICTAINRY